MVQAEGLVAVFECWCPGALSHVWRINGEYLHDDQFPPNVTRIQPSVDSPTARLIIIATPQYNNTVVQCEAIVIEGGVGLFVLSENATLTVQGIYMHLIAMDGYLFLCCDYSYKVLSILWLVSTIYWISHQTHPSPSPGTLPSP